MMPSNNLRESASVVPGNHRRIAFKIHRARIEHIAKRDRAPARLVDHDAARAGRESHIRKRAARARRDARDVAANRYRVCARAGKRER